MDTHSEQKQTRGAQSRSKVPPAPTVVVVKDAGSDSDSTNVDVTARTVYRSREELSEEESCNLLYRLLFVWVSPLLQRGWQRYKDDDTLHAKDLLRLPMDEDSEVCYSEFTTVLRQWRASHPPGSKPNILLLLMWLYKWDMLKGVLWRLLQDSLTVASPFILRALINWMVECATEGTEKATVWKGFVFSLLLALNQLVVSVSTNAGVFFSTKVFSRMRSATVVAIYEKVLRMDYSDIPDTGRVQQMHISDTYKFIDLSIGIQSLWATPTIIVAALISLYVFAGWAGLTAVGVVLVVTPMQVFLSRRMMLQRRAAMTFADARINAITELCQGIRVIKFMSWETPIMQNIRNIRVPEVARYNVLYMYRSVVHALMFSTPMIVAIAVFGSAYALGQPITVNNVFPALAMINILRQPLTQLPMTLGRLVDANVGIERIREFLMLPERTPYLKTIPRGNRSKKAPESGEGESSESAIIVKNATVLYEEEKNKVRKELMGPVSFSIPRGKLTLIIGATGSGKSTLINLMIGESLLKDDGGEVWMMERVAYLPQEAWVMNASLRDNIVMGKSFDPDRYVEAVRSCQLLPDLHQLDNSDMTEIGERGINISGGQKQRVAFARAVYSGQDVILMDDPLSAVDAHVCSGLFDECICGALNGSTRVLVTHHVSFAPRADNIIVVDNRKIVFQGTYTELTHAPPEVLALVKQCEELERKEEEEEQEKEPSERQSETAARSRTSSFMMKGESLRQYSIDQNLLLPPRKPAASVTGSIVDDDVTSVSTRVDGALESLACGEPPATASEGKGAGSNWEKEVSNVAAMHASGLIDAKDECNDALALIPLPKGKDHGEALMTTETQVHGAVKKDTLKWFLHKQGLGLFALTMVGFAVARVVSIAAELSLSQWTSHGPIIGHAMSERQYVVWYGVLIVASVVLMIVQQLPFNKSMSSVALNSHADMLQRLLHAPSSFFDTTPAGRIISRFSKDQENMDITIPWALITFYQVLFTLLGSLCLIAYSLPLIIVILIALIVLYGSIYYYYTATNRALKRLESVSRTPMASIMNETLGGLAIIRAYNMVSHYETRHHTANNVSSRTTHSWRASQRWLSVRVQCVGVIIIFTSGMLFCSATLLYSNEKRASSLSIMSLALTNSLAMCHYLFFLTMSCGDMESAMNGVERVKEFCEDIPQERVVVYRGSGSGAHHGPPPPSPDWPQNGELIFENASMRYRPELPLVLKNISMHIPSGCKVGVVGRTGSGKSSLMLAIFRIVELCEGRMLLSGRDAATLDMYDLRSKITIIPQDPLLFHGSIRSNVDPYNASTDEAVWEVINKVGLRDRVESSGMDLMCPVSPRGANFSVGQRQLICLARALLKKSKVLLLDEATASVDLDSDARIQATIRTEFAACTVITIAHRLATIMDSDLVAVLDNGVLYEYEAPHTLLQRTASIFYGMVSALGDDQLAQMKVLAQAHWAKTPASNAPTH